MNLPVLPILIPLAFIIVLLVTPRKWKINSYLGITATFILLLVSILIFKQVSSGKILVLQAGSWPAPFGISMVIDLFSAIMLVMSGIIGFSVAIYSNWQLDRERLNNRFFVFYLAVLMGVNGAFTTGDIFNLYVWFEVMIISSFVLITLGGKREQLRGAIKYVSMNLVSSLFFLAGIGLLYGKTGTLNMADLSEILRNSEEAVLINTSAMLFFIAFGIKSAVFPLFFWLPASYHTPPVSITAFFAGLLTKVGIYSMIRFFTMFFFENISFWQFLLLLIGGLTMVVGVLTAASQYEMRKILTFHIISQVGYMVMGLGFFTVAGIAGAIFFIAHNMISKTAAFLAAGAVHKITGSYELKSLGGLYKSHPFLSFLFLLPAMSLAGIPPLSGFVGKLYLVLAGIRAEKYLITAVAVAVSLLTLFSMLKIWNEVFWKKNPNLEKPDISLRKLPLGMGFPLFILAILSLVMGVFGGILLEISKEAASQLFSTEGYILNVLKNGMK